MRFIIVQGYKISTFTIIPEEVSTDNVIVLM